MFLLIDGGVSQRRADTTYTYVEMRDEIRHTLLASKSCDVDGNPSKPRNVKSPDSRLYFAVTLAAHNHNQGSCYELEHLQQSIGSAIVTTQSHPFILFSNQYARVLYFSALSLLSLSYY